MKLVPVHEKNIAEALEILNSNKEYNYFENGRVNRTLDEARNGLMNGQTKSYLIGLGHQWIGIIDYLEHNPKDHSPWLGLLMIKACHHGRGYGKTAYRLFEKELKKDRMAKLRLGVLQTNQGAKAFWGKMGFNQYGTSIWEGKAVDCYQKTLE